LEPVGDLSEIVGYRVIENCGSTSHGGASVAGQLIADRVGEITARRELKPSRASTTRAPREPFVAFAADAPTGGLTAEGDPHAAAGATVDAGPPQDEGSHFALRLGSAGAPRNRIGPESRRQRHLAA